MNRAKIGLIGGAGPSAGGLLFEQLIKHCQEKYACKQDYNFPHIMLVNYPFSDMLAETLCSKTIKNELQNCIKDLKSSGCSIIAIACNTLHLFLEGTFDDIDFVHMIEETKEAVNKISVHRPVVLCSSTAARNSLHKQYFDCEYATEDIQKILDTMIADITEGKNLPAISQQLSSILAERYQNFPIILGCTEFSYLHEKKPMDGKFIYDPSNIVAERIADIHYD